MTTSPSSHAFFYVYYITLAGHSLGRAIIGLITFFRFPDSTVPSSWEVAIGTALGLIGMVVFVLSIVAIFYFRKRRYPRLALLGPIARLTGSAVAFIIGLIFFSYGFRAMTERAQQNPSGFSPDDVPALLGEGVIRAMSILSFGLPLVFFVIAVVVLLRFRTTSTLQQKQGQ